MTDLATKPIAAEGLDDALSDPAPEEQPADEKRSRKGLWLGIGIPSGLVVAGVATACAILIAPGTTVLGAPIGWQMPGQAQQTIADHVANTEITVDVEGSAITLTGAELGLSVDADGAAERAYGTNPLWNVTAWNSEAGEPVLAVDEAQAAEALEAAAPELFTAPVNAQIAFEDGAFTAIADEPGLGVDTASLAADIQAAMTGANASQALASGAQILAAGGDSVSVSASVVETEAPFTLADAEAAAEQLDGIVAGTEFTLDGAEVDSPGAKTVASWFAVDVSDDGEVSIAADADAIQAYADSLPEKVDQEAVDAEVVVNAAGDALHTVQEGQDGYRVTSVDGVGSDIAAQLEAFRSPSVALEGETVPHETSELFRRAVVSISDGYSYFYESVNGGPEELVNSFAHAVGKPGYETQVGEFTVYGQLTIQHMGDCDAAGNYVPNPNTSFDYCTPNVPYPTYFNGDQGFHGTYWHGNFGPGAAMSHGCVNLTVSASEWVYRFLQVGSPVSVVA